MPGTLQDYAQAVHDVITVCRDGEQGFRGAAQAVKAPTMKEMFEQYSAQRGPVRHRIAGSGEGAGL